MCISGSYVLQLTMVLGIANRVQFARYHEQIRIDQPQRLLHLLVLLVVPLGVSVHHVYADQSFGTTNFLC